MPEQSAISTDAKSTNNGFSPPEWVVAGLCLLTFGFSIVPVWLLNHPLSTFPPTVNAVIALALPVSVVAFAIAAVWVLRTNRRELRRFRVQRQDFISQQQTAFDSAHHPTIVMHRSGRLELTNTAAELLFGRQRGELLGKDISLVLEIDDSDSDLSQRLKLSEDELNAGVVREAWARDGEGKRIPVEITMRHVAGTNGGRIGAFIRDVSERRSAQDALRESERQFRLLVNGVSDQALFMVDKDGNITNWNAGAERLSGYSAEEVIGNNMARFHSAEEQAAGAPQQLLERALRDGHVELQGWRTRRDGSQFWADMTLDSVYDEDGTLVGFAKITRDITERKRMEQLKDEFVSTVNHELRTPLTSIAGSLGLLAGGAGGDMQPGAARLITIAHANCQRLIRLINDMLDVEKIQSGKMRFDMVRLPLSDTVRRSVEAMHGYSEQAKVRIAVSIEDTDIDIRGDSDRLVQVFTNLISNAVKFSPAKGQVHVSVSRAGRLARFRVRDEGPGIPDEFRSRIFSKFAQADSSDTRQKGGTGLGLTIAKEIVDRHGGRLWFESEVGKGASFFVDLPLERSASEPAGPLSGPTLLICEDDPDAAAILREILEHDGLSVEITDTLEATRTALARPDRFGALVLDLILPDGDGLGLIRELRARADTKELPIIVVSAHAQRGRQELDGNAFNVVDWMDKPIELERLRHAVQVALRRVTTRRPLILHVEDDRDILQITTSALEICGEVVGVESLADARVLLARRTPDLVILDVGLADGSGLELLPELSRHSGFLIPVIVFSAQDTDQRMLPQVKAVMTKSKTSLIQLAQMVQHVLDEPVAERERKVAI